jgi:hypothetical protein
LNDRRCAGISLFHNLFLSPPSCLWLVGLCWSYDKISMVNLHRHVICD